MKNSANVEVKHGLQYKKAHEFYRKTNCGTKKHSTTFVNNVQGSPI